MEEKLHQLITERLQKGNKELSKLARQLSNLTKSISVILKQANLGRNILLYAHSDITSAKRILQKLSRFEYSTVVSTINHTLDDLQRTAQEKAKLEVMRMLSTLEEKLHKNGLALEGRYPTLNYGVITIEFVETADGITAKFYYGPKIHLLGKEVAEPGRLCEKIEKLARELDSSLMEDNRFLPFVFEAWRTALFRKGLLQSGSRVPILDVLLELSLLMQSSAFRKNPTKSSFQSYGQVRFSYQLFRLKNRVFQHNELTLGVATREDVKNRQSLWIPRNLRGEGVHYSTLGFRRLMS